MCVQKLFQKYDLHYFLKADLSIFHKLINASDSKNKFLLKNND